jgi:cobaltochelatase CobS
MSTTDDMIECKIDGGRCHSIRLYLREKYPDWTVERYRAEYPDAPLFSEKGRATALKAKAAKEAQLKAESSTDTISFCLVAKPMHEVFELDPKLTKNKRGAPISVNVQTGCYDEAKVYLQPIDPDYFFSIDLLKTVCLAYQFKMNVYLWGLHGTGKTTIAEQAAARTGRPFLRVQHTGNTEESHILGQYVVKTIAVEEEVLDAAGNKVKVMVQRAVTEFQLGPLALAMKYGMVYCADEYDFAMPSVIALYQPVLEGKALVIKDAPVEHRVIHPHPDFRFVATGNTNGVGDETGLYQGTMIQNAASYSRFHITEEVNYMPAEQEQIVLRSKAGSSAADAAKFVDVANKLREAFRDQKISMTLSPRELINAARLSILYGNDYMRGLKQAFVNRCSRTDQITATEIAQRVFG